MNKIVLFAQLIKGPRFIYVIQHKHNINNITISLNQTQLLTHATLIWARHLIQHNFIFSSTLYNIYTSDIPNFKYTQLIPTSQSTHSKILPITLHYDMTLLLYNFKEILQKYLKPNFGIYLLSTVYIIIHSSNCASMHTNFSFFRTNQSVCWWTTTKSGNISIIKHTDRYYYNFLKNDIVRKKLHTIVIYYCILIIFTLLTFRTQVISCLILER